METYSKFKNAPTPFVSVIVPIYNVEKYLKLCLDSIIAQTYDNFEVILVDDGSPDRCGMICNKYAERYNFIKVIHQSNQGVSAARNNGVLKSKGDLITFIDPDDCITEDYLEYLVSLIIEYNADISVGGSIYQYENKKVKIPKNETYRTYYNPSEAISRMNYVNGFGTVVWAKLYKRSLVEANPFPIGRRYEDVATTYKIVGDSTGLAYGNKQIYIWFQRHGSFMHKKFDKSQFDGIIAVRQQLKYVEKKYPKAIPAAKYRYTAKMVELTDLLFSTSGNKYIFKKLRRISKKYAADVLRDKNAKLSMKIRIIGMQLGYYPARIVFLLHKMLKSIVL